MEPEPKQLRGYGELLIGRWSHAHATYFLTGRLRGRGSGLTEEPVASAVRGKLHELEAERAWTLRTFVLMPDHFHLVVTLGEMGSLSDAMRSFKGPLAPVLRSQGIAWQTGFYDHRLRSPEELLPTFRYIYLNPYRAGLIATGEKWPWYFCASEDWAWFGDLTDDGQPFPEWLQ